MLKASTDSPLPNQGALKPLRKELFLSLPPSPVEKSFDNRPSSTRMTTDSILNPLPRLPLFDPRTGRVERPYDPSRQADGLMGHDFPPSLGYLDSHFKMHPLQIPSNNGTESQIIHYPEMQHEAAEAMLNMQQHHGERKQLVYSNNTLYYNGHGPEPAQFEEMHHRNNGPMEEPYYAYPIPDLMAPNSHMMMAHGIVPEHAPLNEYPHLPEHLMARGPPLISQLPKQRSYSAEDDRERERTPKAPRVYKSSAEKLEKRRIARQMMAASHECPRCFKCFKRAEHFRRHILTHTGESKRVCTFF